MNNQETFESWQARDFLLDEIDKIENQEERLLALYAYLMLADTFNEDLED